MILFFILPKILSLSHCVEWLVVEELRCDGRVHESDPGGGSIGRCGHAPQSRPKVLKHAGAQSEGIVIHVRFRVTVCFRWLDEVSLAAGLGWIEELTIFCCLSI